MKHQWAQKAPRTNPGAVLTRATLRAAGILSISQKDLAAVLGISPASLTRLAKGSREIDPQSKEGELAALFLRVFRSLDALVGGNDEKSRHWLQAENSHLQNIPAALIQTVSGLVHVVEYLDAMRGNF